MQFSGLISGTLESWGTKATKGDGANVSKARFTVRMDQKQLTKSMGKEFSAMIFSSFSEDDGKISCGFEKLRPQGKWESHSMELNEEWRKVHPKILNISPVENEMAVVVTLELQLVLGDEDDLAGLLHSWVGEGVTFEIDPSQQQLPLGDGGEAAVIDGPFGNQKVI